MFRKIIPVFLITFCFAGGITDAAMLHSYEKGADNFYWQDTQFYGLNAACVLTLIHLQCVVEPGLKFEKKDLFSIFNKNFKFNKRFYFRSIISFLQLFAKKKEIQGHEELLKLVENFVKKNKENFSQYNLVNIAIQGSNADLRKIFSYLHTHSSEPFGVYILQHYLSEHFSQTMLAHCGESLKILLKPILGSALNRHSALRASIVANGLA